MNIIYAIDPGPEQSGWVLWDHDRSDVIDSGVSPNEDIVKYLRQSRNDNVCEMIASYGMPVGAEVFETCVWIGRFLEASAGDFTRIFRREVKLHLCNSAKAKDANIWQALVDRFGPPGTKAKPGKLYGVKSHARAALALAVTYGDLLE